MANTLKFGDGKWGAKKDSILAYNDENANFKPLPFTTSRSSTATRINKAGLIEKVENGIPRVDYLGNTKGAMLLEPQSTNLIQYSEAFGTTYWTKSGATIEGDPTTAGSELITNISRNSNFSSGATDWASAGNHTASVVGNELQVVASGSGINSSNATTLLATNFVNSLKNNVTYKYTFSARASSGTPTLTFRMPAEIGPNTTNVVLSTLMQTFTIYGTRLNLDNAFFSLNSAGTFYIDNISMKEVKGFVSPSADTLLGAFKLVENSSNSVHTIRSQETTVSGVAHTFSLLAKADGRDFIKMRLENAGVGSGQANVWFDVKNGVVGTIGSGTAKIELISDGWYRCSITGTTNGTSYLSRVYLADANGSDSYTGNGTSGVYIFGAQLEQKPYSTSYIPNYGESAGVTRLKDTCIQTPISGIIGQTEGVLYCEVNIKSGYDTNNLMVTLSDTSAKQIYINRSNGKLEFFISNSLTYLAPSVLTNGIHKLALAYKQDDFAVAIDGVIAYTDTIGNVPTCNKINVGSHFNENLPFNDRINDLKLYNTRLSNSELQALTTI